MDSNKTTEPTPSTIPTIHIVSDSVGATASAVARAAASQFGVTDPRIEVLPMVKTFEEVRDFFEYQIKVHSQAYDDDRFIVFYTLVDTQLRKQISEYLSEHPHIVSVDLMSDAVGAIASMTGLEPAYMPGTLRQPDVNYFNRIEAEEFAIEHDDGRNPQDLTQADIVLVGVSRSTKTPLSVYLSQLGYKVANVPLDPLTEPPRELYDVDPTRIFGLMSDPDVLVDIRKRRLGDNQTVASRYAEPEYVYEDLENAHKLMRKLGCIIIHTEKRAIEETAQEILRYYERFHPAAPYSPDIM